MQLANAMIFNFFRALIPVKHRAHPCEVAAIVERAWIDNVEDRPWRRCYARIWVRDEFQRNVSAFVRGFYARTGTYPVGDHDVTGMGRGRVSFAPRPLAH